MPEPFVLIQLEDNSVSETTIVGVQDMVSIIVDWDNLDGDADQAQDLIDEIVARYGIGEGIGGDGSEVGRTIHRLEAIVQAVRDEEEDDEDSGILDDDEEDEEDDEDVDLDYDAELEAEDAERS